MVTMNRNDRHLCSGGASGKDTIAGEIPGGLLHVVVLDDSRPGSDELTVLRPPWLTVAIASGPSASVNRMVRRWISRQAFGTERFSSPAE
jgi:hypothetical protein